MPSPNSNAARAADTEQQPSALQKCRRSQRRLAGQHTALLFKDFFSGFAATAYAAWRSI